MYVDDVVVKHTQYVCYNGHVWEDLESQDPMIFCRLHSSDIYE
jgi:hypothetical protein